MKVAFTRTRFTWMAYFTLAFYGFYMNILGPITPFLKDDMKLSYTLSSLHYAAFALGMILAGLLNHLVVDRIGRKKALWIGAGLMGVGALLLIVGRVPSVTISACFFMGLVGTLIPSVVNAGLSDQFGEMRAVALSESNVISSLVSSSAPLLVGWFALTFLSWRAALSVGILGLGVLWMVFHQVKLPEIALVSESTTKQTQKGALPAIFWAYWTAIILVVAVEFCMISWSADYMETVLHLPKANAAQAVSLFLAGMIVGRLATSRLVQRFTTRAVLFVGMLLTCVGFATFWLAQSAWMGSAGLVLSGLGTASLFPLVLSLALGVASHDVDRASVRVQLAAGIAIFLLPLTLGRIADAIGIHQAYLVVPGLIFGAFLIILLTDPAKAADLQTNQEAA